MKKNVRGTFILVNCGNMYSISDCQKIRMREGSRVFNVNMCSRVANYTEMSTKTMYDEKFKLRSKN
jgi:hypothetical protein